MKSHLALGALLFLFFTACADDPETTPAPPACGNGILEAGEVCDDGNRDDGDACTNACILASCGDGIVQAGVEACDDGNEIETDGCLSTCVAASCGDGFVQAGLEECDDGNDVDTDACLSTCVLARCGDGLVHEGFEACDDGNDDDLDGCRATCIATTCGDGVVQPGNEVCDDANDDDTDECLSNCLPARCGDGHIQAGVELCDDGNDDDGDGCPTSCQPASCGDGFVHRGEEACDDGPANSDLDPDACRKDCRQHRCGDRVIDTGEACDDGNLDSDDGCIACVLAFCGDGQLHRGVEECDLGAANDDELPGGCRTTCRLASCGDGVVDPGEECDDANDDRNDSCSSCRITFCGDGQVQAGEGCDDGSRNSDTTVDACRSNCQPAGCGDGIIDSSESCDDRNTDDRDLCSNLCSINGDTCSTAARLAFDAANAFVVQGNTATMGADYQLGCDASGRNGDQVFEVTAPVHGYLHLALAANFNAGIAVQASCGVESTNLACAQQLPAGQTERLRVELLAGQTVFLLVDGSSNFTINQGPFTLSGQFAPLVPPGSACDPAGMTSVCDSGFVCPPRSSICEPSVCGDGVLVPAEERCDDGNIAAGDGCSPTCTMEGDTCSQAGLITPLANGTFSFTGSTVGLSNASRAAGCATTSASGDVYLAFTSPTAASWTFRLAAEFNSVLALRTSCSDSATNLGCHDASGNKGGEQITATLRAGETVYLLVDGWGSSFKAEGLFTLTGTSVPVAPVGASCADGRPCAPGSSCAPGSQLCVATCGNGVVDVASRESCDDGNLVPRDGCSDVCTLDPGFACRTPGALCVPVVCGDGFIDAPEECDDSNTVPGDGCSATCAVEATPLAASGLALEFRNRLSASDPRWGPSSTGCTRATRSGHAYDVFYVRNQKSQPVKIDIKATPAVSTIFLHLFSVPWDPTDNILGCLDAKQDPAPLLAGMIVEPGAVLAVVVSAASATAAEQDYGLEIRTLTVCGDGVWSIGEECEDGGTRDGDGCSSSCRFEPGFTCREGVGCFANQCGDGVRGNGEICDDGNAIDNDSCTSTCQIHGTSCSSPAVLTAGPDHRFLVYGNTALAGADFNLGCTPAANHGDQAFQFTAPIHGIWSFEVASSTFLAALAVQSSCGDNSSDLGCNAEGGLGAKRVTVELIPNETVYLIVDGDGYASTGQGPFTLQGSVKPILQPGQGCDVQELANRCAFGSRCDATLSHCVATYCGNGTIEPGGGETCDDGNSDDWDACSNTCQIRGEDCGAPFDLRRMDTDPAPGSLLVTGNLLGRSNDHTPSCFTMNNPTAPYGDLVYTLEGNGSTDEHWTLTLVGAEYNDMILDINSACGLRNTRIACTPNANLANPQTLSFVLGASETVYVWVDMEPASMLGFDFTLRGSVVPVVASGAACDPAATANRCTDGTACVSGFCSATQCGNGLIESGESCDDGNLVSGDGCSATCVKEGDTCDLPFYLNALGSISNASPWIHNGTWVGMTANYTPTCAQASGNNDVVYSFTAPQAGLYSFTETGPANVVIYATSACPETYRKDLACADDPETISLQLSAGETVYVYVDPAGHSPQGEPSGIKTYTLEALFVR